MYFGSYVPAKAISCDDEEDLPETVRSAVMLNIDDSVICRTYMGRIIEKGDTPWDKERTFRVIGLVSEGVRISYAVYAPHDYNLAGLKINPALMRRFGISSKFAGDMTLFITSECVIRVHRDSDAMNCAKCNERVPHVKPNVSTTDFHCYRCRI